MTKAMIVAILTTIITFSASAMVVKGHDAENSCDLYRVVVPEDNKPLAKLESEEIIIYANDVYGFSFQDMEVNFDNREVLVQPMINIIMGKNRPLTEGKAIIANVNPQFYFLINQLNRKIYLFEKICIADGKIAYAKMFEPKSGLLK